MTADIPEEIEKQFAKFYPSQIEAKKIKKPMICYLLDIDKTNRTRPTLVAKPIKVKYGKKWFDYQDMRYFINYNELMNFGKHYAYLCQFGNSVGALSFYEYPDIGVDANQTLLMVNQHAVEVFKKHKGISPKLVMIIAIACVIAIIGLVITVNVALGQNNQINTLKTENSAIIAENKAFRCQLDSSQCPPITTIRGGQ